MNKNLLIKLSIFIAIIISQIVPLPQAVSTAQAAQCCDINCGINTIDKRACPTQMKTQFCKSSSLECCKDECLYSSKDSIILNKGVSLRKLSQVLSVAKGSLINEPQLFNQLIKSFPCQKSKFQNNPLFQINSVYLI
tara:strand:- start:4653 stop:5063 length:411 start_codon:yes stop_codon:yes gene_type:complete